MLVVFYGNDQIKVRSQAFGYIDKNLQAEQLLIKLEPDTYEEGQLASLSQTNVLFGLTPIYLVDTLSLNKTAYEEFLSLVSDIANSDATFVIIEQSLLTADKKVLTKHAYEIEEFKKSAEMRFNPFGMADALARKDKRLLWMLLQEARANNLVAEEIIGTLWWQLKTMRLASLTKSASEAGVKDYPYNKAKQALKNFKTGEIEKISAKLLKLYHEAHAGRRDIDLALEEWVLKI